MYIVYIFVDKLPKVSLLFVTQEHVRENESTYETSVIFLMNHDVACCISRNLLGRIIVAIEILFILFSK